MGRPRSFDESVVVARAGALFLERGYGATSVDELVAACGLHRGSLYKAFGSKRGVFLAALRRLVDDQLPAAVTRGENLVTADVLDLLLVAALELAPGDREVRSLVRRACALLTTARTADSASGAALLGQRLLHRAGVPTDDLARTTGDTAWHG